MAVETTVKTIGTTGRQYSTLQTWEDGGPASLTTAERWTAASFTGAFTIGETVTGTGLTAGKVLDTDGSTYITIGIVTGNTASVTTLTGSTSTATCALSAKTHTGVIWQGQAHNDTEFVSSSTLLTMGGSTTSASCYKELTAAAGKSFQDNAHTLALTYNASLGVAIRNSVNYGSAVVVTDAFARISRVMIRGQKGQLLWYSGTSGAFIAKDILVFNSDNSATIPISMTATSGTTLLVNVLYITDSPGTVTAWVLAAGSHTLHGCVCVRTSNRTATGPGFVTSYAQVTKLVSCGVFGFTTCFGNIHADATTGSKNNATDQASGLPGTSNQHAVTYSSATPFTVAAGTANDMRSIAGTALISNGFLDATNAPNDIGGVARSSTPTIGHYEVAGGATTTSAVGAAAGTASVSATGTASAAGVGATSGAGVALATGAAITSAIGATSGAATALATGGATATAIGAASGAATATGITGAITAAGVGASSGAASASATGAPIAAGVGSTAAPSYTSTILADGPSHYWRLGDASGTTAADTVGGGTPGTIIGGVTLGQPGPLADGSTAMAFDGATGKIQTATVTLAAVSTLELWVKPTSDLTVALRPLVAWGSSQSPTTYMPVVGGTKRAALYDPGTGGNGSVSVTGTVGLSPNVWHHVVFVFTGTTLVLYVDGAVDTLGPASRVVASVDTVQIGADPAFGSSDPRGFADGSLAEVTIYPAALTAGQIAAHYAARTTTAAVSTATAIGAALMDGVGAAAGTGQATGTGRATGTGVGVAAGSAAALATSEGTMAGVGVAAGVSSTTAGSLVTASGVGASAGLSTATASAARLLNAVGLSAGAASAQAVSQVLAASVGHAAGRGDAAAFSPNTAACDYVTMCERLDAELTAALDDTYAGIVVSTRVFDPMRLPAFTRYCVIISPAARPWSERHVSVRQIQYTFHADLYVLVHNFDEVEAVYGPLGLLQLVEDVKATLRSSTLSGLLYKTYDEPGGEVTVGRVVSGGLDSAAHVWVHRARIPYTGLIQPFAVTLAEPVVAEMPTMATTPTVLCERVRDELLAGLFNHYLNLVVDTRLWDPARLPEFTRYCIIVAPHSVLTTERRVSLETIQYGFHADLHLLVHNFEESDSVFGKIDGRLGLIQLIDDAKVVLRSSTLSGLLDKTYDEPGGPVQFEMRQVTLASGAHIWIQHAVLPYLGLMRPFSPTPA